MSLSTNAILTFGIQVQEDALVPWWDEEYDWDIKVWWVVQHGWDTKRYDHKLKSQMLKDKPIPIEYTVHCSNDYEMFIIGIPDLTTIARMGHPSPVKQEDLRTPTEEEIKTLTSFVKKYNIPTQGKVGWWLCSWRG